MTSLRTVALCLTGLAFILTGCGDETREFRQYREFTLEKGPSAAPSSPAGMPAAPATGSSAMGELPPGMNQPSAQLDWTTPEGWSVRRESGLRLATFTIEDLECSLLTFPGDVGGTEANLRRWLGQLGVGNAAPDAVSSLINNAPAFTTGSGLTGRLYDLSPLVPAGASNGMLAAILELDNSLAFLKCTGPIDQLNRHRAGFEALASSIRPAGQPEGAM